MATHIKLGVLLFICVASQGGSALPANVTLRQQQSIDSYELVYNPCNNIRQAGFVCVDCGTLGYCIHVDNQWQTVEMTTCKTDGGFYCSDEGAIGCAWGMQCTVPVRGKFYCQLPGKYPDPYDCRSYHECSELNDDTPRRCQNGYAYSTLTESCTMPTTSDSCTEKQYECNYIGQMGAWRTNPSFYYVCQREQQGDVDIYYPLMLQCQAGYVFNGRVCVPEQTAKIVAIEDKGVEKEKEVRLSDGDDKNLKKVMLLVEAKNAIVPLAGGDCSPNFALSADASDCSHFLLCYEGVWLKNACPEGTHFDVQHGVCLSGSCIELVGGDCLADFTISADASDCSGFLLCLEGGWLKNACPEGTHFDVQHGVCLSGSCTGVARMSAVAADACTNTYELKANADDCNGYLACQQGAWMSYTCPEGSHFDATYAVCRHGSCNNVNTDSGSVTAVTNTKCQRIGMTADLSDCNRFYYCAQRNADVEHKSCPMGSIYDPNLFACIVGSC